MQHVMVMFSAMTGGPVVIPNNANLWRDDQDIMWTLGPGYEWDNVDHPNAAVVFNPPDRPDQTDAWPGTQPAPIPAITPIPLPDTRPYVASGPGANTDENGAVLNYAYTLFVIDKAGKKIRIDPDISNQPHPP